MSLSPQERLEHEPPVRQTRGMRMSHSILRSLAASAPLLLAIAPAIAHDAKPSHVHVGGGLSHEPHTFTNQIWYRDIVYDTSAADPQYTSLDVYVPDPVEPGSPVMVWVHGGGLRMGDKASSKDLGPKPEYFANKLGYLLVSVNYRVLPEGRYPRNVQDLANSIAWVHNNIAKFGGDPEQIFLMGHSAGAGLATQVATDATFLKNAGKDLKVLKGVIANEGGSYDLADADAKRNEASYGPQWRQASAIAHVTAGKGIPPFLFFHVAGGSQVGNTQHQALAMADALRRAGVRAEVVALDHVEHFGANERMGDPGDVTTVSLERFLESIPGKKRKAQWTAAKPLS
jgi:arylformamidase